MHFDHDKTYCVSPECVNACGRKLTPELRDKAIAAGCEWLSQAYFCGETKDGPFAGAAEGNVQ